MSNNIKTITMIGTILDISIVHDYNEYCNDYNSFYDNFGIYFPSSLYVKNTDFFVLPHYENLYVGIIIKNNNKVKIEDIPKLAEKAKREIKRVLDIDVDEVELIVFSY